MNRKGFDLAVSYAERVLGRPMADVPPIRLSGSDVISIVWPLNDIFRPHMDRTKSVRYEARYEPEADEAVETFAGHASVDVWLSVSAGAWRVLLERHVQVLMLAKANLAAAHPVTIIPHGLPEKSKLPWIMLTLLHSMALPFPVEDRSSFVIPTGAVPGPMRPQ